MSDTAPQTNSEGYDEFSVESAADSSSDETAPAGEPSPKPKLQARYKALVAEYGGIAIVTYLSIFVVTIGTFALLIKVGITVEGANAEAGVWFSAWVATKLTQPARFVATFALTPLVATGWRRLRGRPTEPLGEVTEAEEE